eukprot:1188618-Prymnesium_polylepis.1
MCSRSSHEFVDDVAVVLYNSRKYEPAKPRRAMRCASCAALLALSSASLLAFAAASCRDRSFCAPVLGLTALTTGLGAVGEVCCALRVSASRSTVQRITLPEARHDQSSACEMFTREAVGRVRAARARLHKVSIKLRAGFLAAWHPSAVVSLVRPAYRPNIVVGVMWYPRVRRLLAVDGIVMQSRVIAAWHALAKRVHCRHDAQLPAALLAHVALHFVTNSKAHLSERVSQPLRLCCRLPPRLLFRLSLGFCCRLLPHSLLLCRDSRLPFLLCPGAWLHCPHNRLGGALLCCESQRLEIHRAAHHTTCLRDVHSHGPAGAVHEVPIKLRAGFLAVRHPSAVVSLVRPAYRPNRAIRILWDPRVRCLLAVDGIVMQRRVVTIWYALPEWVYCRHDAHLPAALAHVALNLVTNLKAHLSQPLCLRCRLPPCPILRLPSSGGRGRPYRSDPCVAFIRSVRHQIKVSLSRHHCQGCNRTR